MSQHFKIVCTGWKNWPWVKNTVESILIQDYWNYDVCLVDDMSEDADLTKFIPEICKQMGWKYILNTEHMRAVYNQVAAIRLMDPDPEDVIVWLDPDGDKFAHSGVLSELVEAYSDGSRLVYSKYICEPDSPTSSQSRPHPDWVVERNAYREFTREHGIYYNHLRSMKAALFLEMEDADFQDDEGVWFPCGTDSVFMFPAMELARGKVKFLDKIQLIYRPDYELSDWRRYPDKIDWVHDLILRRPPKC
jgi:cellulose synthase/poly-beta-1,6-N-acetylglucosamine synthase-like glycosyltransferase